MPLAFTQEDFLVCIKMTQEILHHFFVMNLDTRIRIFRRRGCTSGSRIWSRLGPQKFFPRFCRRSEAEYWQGSRTYLRAQEALTFLTVKYAFSHFPGTFSSNYLMYICVDKLQNIYFNMKDSEHVANAIFLFFI